ncbi:MAG: tetratricopeptide repeat protein [Planctomycetes bacterium]|nr:tetratricopeptide repeat protein [Planctomycetota bacterium]
MRRLPATRLFVRCFVGVALLLLAAIGFAELKGGEDLLIQRKYAEAATAIAGVLPQLPVEDQARGAFLLGHARLLAGDAKGAIEAFLQLQQQHGQSTYAAAGGFLRAKALERSGDLRAAAQLYRSEVERLVGLQRKEDVAATYLGLATKALAVEPPQFATAVTFFDQALDLGLSPAKARAVRLQAAEALAMATMWKDAAQRLKPLLAELDAANGRLRAMLALGRALRNSGDRSGARAVLRDLRAEAPDSAEAADAAYEVALAYGVPEPAANEIERAVGALRELVASYPAHPKARIADYLLARCYLHAGRSEDALTSLAAFLQAHGDQPLAEVAEARALQGDVLREQGRFPAAIAAYREYLSRHPAHGLWERVQQAIVDTEFALANAAYAGPKPDFALARERFAQFAAAYPLDSRNPQLLYELGEMLLQEKKFDEAREAFARCVAKYPGKEASSRAQLEIGRIFETRTFNYEAALTAYRAVEGPYTRQAMAALQRLVAKSLALRTDHVFRTDEKAVFQVTSRNLEKVRVRVYRLELEDYFRAVHTTGDIERLDIEVIAADRQFDSPVPDYKKYRETSRDVEIGFDRPGAYVVKVDDQELEATTMVLVSDLALISKSSRHEFLVFAQNVREQRAEGGVKVVLSDGKKVLGEGVTGADGVYRWKGAELQQTSGLSVFAVNAVGSGASSLDLSELSYSAGLTAKGYLYTDRPLYQPGQRMFCKGLVREVKNGVYEVPTASDYRLRVYNPSGRVALAREITFSAFGGFASELDLPADAELGNWRLQVDRTGSPEVVFHGQFLVAKYERPRLFVDFVFDEQVVFRGEPVRGRAVLRHFYGEPAVGKSIQVTMALPDGKQAVQEGTTNAAGEVPFTFATTEFAEEAYPRLVVTVPGEDVTQAAFVSVVTTELAVAVRTVRPVYLAGETFAVQADVRDRSGKPLARQATAVLLRLEPSGTAPNGQSEVEQARVPLRTDASGKGSAVLSAAKGGRYRVRVELVDRFGTSIAGTTDLQISGEDDDVKLRLLGERDTYHVGETAQVKVMNRAGERLALLTWQGDGILAYESRRLPAGESMLSLPLQTMHAPNFAFALAMIDGSHLHEAQRDFRVERDLQITLSMPSSARPGSEVEVAVLAKDAEGRPVAAEVSLALVDEALWRLTSANTPPIGAFFHGQLRDTAFATTSSCTWSYRGTARRVSEALLAEERRAESEQVLLREQEGRESAFDSMQQSGFDSNQRNSAVRLMAQMPAQVQAAGLAQTGSDDFYLGGTRRVLVEQGQAGTLLYDEFDVFSVGGGQNGIALPRVPAPMPNAANEPRTDFRETGAWISALVTGADGRATTKVKLPQSLTAWRLQGYGATVDTQVGEAVASLKTEQELQIELIGPPILTEGDSTTLRVGAHNLTAAALDVELLWEAAGVMAGSGRSTPNLAPHGEQEIEVPVTAGASGELAMTLSAKAGALGDALQRSIPVVPFGVEMRAGRSGSTNDRNSFELSLPEGREYTALQLLVEIGPDPGRDLIAAALGAGFQLQNQRFLWATNLARSSQALGALVVLRYLEQAGTGSKVDRDQLLGLATSVVAGLAAQQLGSGGFAWVGKERLDLRSTCQIVRLLAAAQARGIAGAAELLDGASEVLQDALRTAPTEGRADLVLALAAAGKVRFESINALHRARTSLSVDGLARLAIAWQLMGRPETALEVLEPLRQKLPAASLGKQSFETVALAARALLAADRRDALGTAALSFLQAERQGAGWGTAEATAAALEAIVRAQNAGAGTPKATRVTVRGNGKALLPDAAADYGQVFRVAAADCLSRGNRVEIQVEGGGEVHYRANLVGFGRGFLPGDQNDDRLRVSRSYHAAPLRHDGKAVPAGFAVVEGRNVARFDNKVTQLRVGDRCSVHVSFEVRKEEGLRTMTPLIVEEPIPAGCSVLRSSIQGPFDHVEVQPDRLVFYCREGVGSGTIRYELQARFAGSFRVLPLFAHAALRPELFAYGQPGALRIHARGQGDLDEYRLTPDELFHLGSAWFATGEAATGEVRQAAFGKAYEHLQSLLDGWQKKDCSLRDQPYREVVRMMLMLGIERGDARAVVRFFEELKDRYPELVIPFDKITAVGSSYLDLGEFEAALLVFRATAEASFLKDAAVATVLEQHGEVRAAAEFLTRLLGDYPDLPTMRVVRYSISQKLAAKAAALPIGQAVDEKVGTAVSLRRRALQGLREFLVLHPEDPMAEEVSFAWATTHVEDGDLKSALAVSEAALLRYPGSTFTDELLYTQGYAQFALGQHDQAFAVLRRVADEQFPLPGGGMGASESQWHAVYLQGQIHHARGESALALQAYEKVAERFADAGEARDYFQQKVLSLPEVATFALKEAPELQVSFRNVDKVSVQVFRVDLMRLYLMERSLQDIRGIQLHGIKPQLSFEVELGTGRDYRTVEKKVPLSLPAPGAYLVVLRGGDRLASGMVLRTDLRIEAQEQFDVGRIRVNCKQGEACLADALVKVSAQGDSEVRSGRTDLRGLFVADNLIGPSTVIVQKGDEYAFYRGTGVHQAGRYQPAPVPVPENAAPKPGKPAPGFDAFDNNLNQNSGNRARQVEWLEQNVQNKQQRGVEVRRTK